MKASKFIISTLRDAPNDAVISSHKLMMRSGMTRKLGNGLYAYMPLGYRSYMKVQNIIREELDKAGCLEMKPTVIQPGDLWKESGRWDKMGEEMLKAQNRQGQDMVVSPTAEEAFTALIREGLSSYKQLPFTVYQINTKYRDEIRPRYGVMRGREFTMMDAYSFDKNQEDLDSSYENVAQAYRKIFKRMGLKTISVKADTGAMGGSGSEEFMVESEVGDDTLIPYTDKYEFDNERDFPYINEKFGQSGELKDFSLHVLMRFSIALCNVCDVNDCFRCLTISFHSVDDFDLRLLLTNNLLHCLQQV